jgi:hypothetical protein
VRPALVTAALVALALAGGCACSATVTYPPPADSGPPPGPTLHGRILDLETCPDAEGCRVIEGAVVSLYGDTTVLSEPTGPDGAFALPGVPPGSMQLLRAEATTGQGGAYVTTVNANPIFVGDEDLYGLELYMLSAADGDLLGAIAAEAGVDFRQTGGYVGEVIRREPTAEAVAGAHVELFPADFPMRYVNVIPRYVPDEAVLLDVTATGTTNFGLFAVATIDQEENMGVLVTASGLVFPPLLLPMAPGTVVFGLHVGTPGDAGGADGGVADAGGATPDAGTGP